MSTGIFQDQQPLIAGNPQLRIPQREAFDALMSYENDENVREIGIVLPVGCGKSGCITLSPFAFRSKRTLVVAPGVHIASQLHQDFDPSLPNMFYLKTNVITTPPFPEPVEIRGTTTNRADLEEADVVITNIQQLQGNDNKWLNSLPEDFFDLILFDEGHHSVAATWEQLKNHFPDAKIVNFSATPLRADGQKMAGKIIYTYPIFRAIQEGYVKRLKALVLNPKTLRFVRSDDGKEIDVPLEEVRRLGEEDSDFRRSILTSKETLNTIVDASIRELDRIRSETSDNRHKIIASALNYGHCHQIVEAYRSRGRRADYVHSRQDSLANQSVLAKLENHELDVIVQVRKLGEGFDHPYLSVAAVFSVFSKLSPFVQFVGRIMRVIEQNNPDSPMNQGTVIFHAGANIARRWEDFQEYSEADQQFFDQLLPMEEIDFSDSDELSVEPRNISNRDSVNVRQQTDVQIEEIPLLREDPEAMKAIRMLRERGYSAEEVSEAMCLEPVPTTRVRERQAKRSSLDESVKTEAGRIIADHGLNARGHELDKARLGKTNFVVIKSSIDKAINKAVGRKEGERHEFSRTELDKIEEIYSKIIESVEKDIFDAQT